MASYPEVLKTEPDCIDGAVKVQQTSGVAYLALQQDRAVPATA
jgi:hypothetical protein